MRLFVKRSIKGLRYKDISAYKNVIYLIRDYVLDHMRDGDHERFVYFSEPLKRLLKKETCPLPLDYYYDYATSICYFLEDFKEAKDVFEDYYHYLEKDPKSEIFQVILTNYAIVNFEVGDYKKANALLDELESIVGEELRHDSIAKLTRASIRIAEGKLDGVHEMLSEAVKDKKLADVVENKISCYTLFGKYFEASGEGKKALAWYKKGIKLVEDKDVCYSEQKIYHEYAELLFKNKKFKKSAMMFRKYSDILEKAKEKNRKLIKARSEQEVYMREKDDEAYALIRENMRMRDENSKDYLTGIYNKRYLNDYVERVIESKSRSFSALLFDIDRFKTVNDKYGHLAGDYVIKTTCSFVENLLDQTHTFGRVGGDEFVICFENIEIEEAFKTAEMIQKYIKEHIIQYEGKDIQISISGGMVDINEIDDVSMQKLVEIADKRLYLSKERGRNRITFQD